MFSLKNKKVWIAGHKGMVGSALVRRLEKEECDILTVERSEVDLTNQAQVYSWMEKNKPDLVFLAAAKVGGIHANSTYPASFIYENLMIECNIIHSAYQVGVEKLVFLGSSCIYPTKAPQPMAESALLTGPFEPTNEWYAMAKTAGIKLCQAYRLEHNCDFISAMPTNLYGIGDNFHPQNSHVPAALLARFHDAKKTNLPDVTVWGTGTPTREFLFVDDLADACVFIAESYSDHAHVNVGTGKDISIGEFAGLIKETVGYKGELVFDTSKPDGMMRKVMNVDKLTEIGWSAKTELRQGLEIYYQWFCDNIDHLRAV
ncbi:bifunctional GDP-fucose synthetase: GDP-4-dehydro-6-deoxy-D-mannose epimerase and GDP-4-dehydro-6-L-deoxygalactose reductase [Candidatus Terasakiella magnetica]|uniref:GDP-L-fucose synthase n=1 Tax=Candidatus Terasakiella magnetica TaxID=1867952 RepID=A0A1C3RG50_9PROT|nr:GDP-L-fucose synthase [Candidatus Terasakiella magnetica]SCA56286.1 bifunctional GDP-fucose synthetase: GDP-4-dehydro-6-deoxy-D-mannose epimerase and GDP-4-dehydro-6-L-deoxygalactose reductase [Candidatus Terasakiella magnetica]